MPKKLDQLKEQFENFLNSTIEARSESRRDTDYDDHHQWSQEEKDKLDNRNQAPVVINRVKTKVNLLQGIQRSMRTQPKALPRTPAHEGGADAATKGLRYVKDNAEFEQTSSQVFRWESVWGYGGCITEVQPRGDEFEIVINRIPPDRYFFDPHSMRLDFADKSFDGIAIWMDGSQAKSVFPGNDELIDAAFTLGTNENLDGLEDKPTVWVDSKRKRLRVLQHYYRESNDWYVAFYTHAGFLQKDGKDMNDKSPYLDEHGNSANPIEAQSPYIDQENNRYGEVRSYIWLQDEINHRRSKLLYLLSVRQTIGEEGAVKDITKTKQELAKADGHVEVNPGMQFDLLPTNDMAAGQLEIYRESKLELDSVGANSGLAGALPQDASGRLAQIVQTQDMAELGALYDGHKHWEKRVYRQIWNRIRQFWDAEKWIRVTDDVGDLEWVGLNQPITFGQQLQEAAQGEGALAQQGLSPEEAVQMLQVAMQNQDPRLNEPVEVRNKVAELDVDIILSESPDFATIRQEQFAQLAELAKAYGPQAVPFEVMLRLSEIVGLEDVIDLLRQSTQPDETSQQLQELVTGLEIADKQAEIANTEADTALKQEKAASERVQTIRAAQAPPDNVNVSL